MIFLTSIPPRTHNQEIINSWLQIGKVYSLNSPHEISNLRGSFIEPKFKDVTFIEDLKSEKNKLTYGKPYVNICSFFEFAQTLPQEEIICLINSDIFIQNDETIFNKIISIVHDGGFVAGRRWNYTNDFSDALMEAWGIDFFVMNQNILHLLPTNSVFMMGQTWWDYWLPTVINNLKIPIYKMEQKILFHKKHNPGWSPQSWHTMGKHFYTEMGLKLKDLSYIDGMKVYHDFYDNAGII